MVPVPPNWSQSRRFWERQWREGPWTSSLLVVANVSLDRARLRHQHLRPNWDQFGPRRRYQYLNWDQQEADWEQPLNGTLGTFVCVARNPLGTARRRLRLQLAGTRGYWSYWCGVGGWY